MIRRRTMIGTALTLGAVLFSATLALRFVTEQMKRSSLFFPARYPEGMWKLESLPVRPTEHAFRTPDGVRLHAMLFRAENPVATAIWFHGNAGNISNRAGVASQLAMRGVSVFLFDYRGYGRSEGTPAERALMLDSLAAYDFVRADLGEDPRSIVLYGESLGGAYAAYVAARRPARCVVIENSFPSLSAMAAHHYRGTPFSMIVRRSLTTLDWLNSARIPVLVMHGTEDEVVPFSLGMQLYSGLTVPKQFLRSEGASHSEIPDREGERYYSTVVAFIRTETTTKYARPAR